jgi:hypothetical protein
LVFVQKDLVKIHSGSEKYSIVTEQMESSKLVSEQKGIPCEASHYQAFLMKTLFFQQNI